MASSEQFIPFNMNLNVHSCPYGRCRRSPSSPSASGPYPSGRRRRPCRARRTSCACCRCVSVAVVRRMHRYRHANSVAFYRHCCVRVQTLSGCTTFTEVVSRPVVLIVDRKTKKFTNPSKLHPHDDVREGTGFIRGGLGNRLAQRDKQTQPRTRNPPPTPPP